MKTKFLFASLFASAVMVGCSNEELSVVQDAASNDKLALIFDGFEGVESRMAYDGTNGSFLWQNGDEIGVSRVAGKTVTTNYSFTATKVTDDNTKDLGVWNTTMGAADKYAYFETEFGSIFKGDYVVYYPYDKNFCEDGKIVAKLNVGQTEITASKTEHVAKDGFMMSKAVAFEGGQKAEKFALYPVFGRLVFNIKTAESSEIETIVLRSLNGKTLPTAMEIDADINVVDGKLNPAYMHVIESSKVEEIVMSVDGNDAIATPTTGYTAYFTLIPGTYTNFAIDVVTSNGTFSKTFNSATISSGNRANVNLTFAASDMIVKRTYYATSAASWKTAIDKIAASMTASEAAPATIKVINDIELGANELRPTQAIHGLVPVTVEGQGSLTVAGDQAGSGALTNVKFNVPVKVEGAFHTRANENVHFAAGLKAGSIQSGLANNTYTIDGGKIGGLHYGMSTDTSILTVNNVTFTGAVKIEQSAGLNSNNVAKVNFNGCTFEAGLENKNGAIRVNGATFSDAKANNSWSKLNVASGVVYLNGTVNVEDVDAAGTLSIEKDANVEISNDLAAITGTINVNKDATLTLGSTVNYILEAKLNVEGKLINNGTLSTLTENSLVDVDPNNNHRGILENNGIIRVFKTSYGKWFKDQRIDFVNNAHYNFVILSAADWATYTNKTDITGVEVKDLTSIKPLGKGNNANVKDFSGLNLILNPTAAMTVTIVDGLKFKNIEVMNGNAVTFVVADATKNASFTTGNLNVNGKLKLTKGATANAQNVKANVTNVAIGTTGELENGAQVTYTGTFTNKGTVKGGNPVK